MKKINRKQLAEFRAREREKADRQKESLASLEKSVRSLEAPYNRHNPVEMKQVIPVYSPGTLHTEKFQQISIPHPIDDANLPVSGPLPVAERPPLKVIPPGASSLTVEVDVKSK